MIILNKKCKEPDEFLQIKQLEDSITFFKNQIEFPVYAYAVTSRSPMTSSEIQNEKMRLRKKQIIFDSKNKIMTKNYAEYEDRNKK